MLAQTTAVLWLDVTNNAKEFQRVPGLAIEVWEG